MGGDIAEKSLRVLFCLFLIFVLNFVLQSAGKKVFEKNFFSVNDSCQILLASNLQTLFSHCNSTSLGFPDFSFFLFC